MARFEITEGAPGQGKSLYTARLAKRVFLRNLKWAQKGNPVRFIWSNMKFSEAFEKYCTRTIWEIVRYQGKEYFYNPQEYCFIKYWTDSEKLVTLNDSDIIWDEIATELDARNFANLSVEMKRFLSQYRKRGLDIYANTQDFSMIDARARLMISNVRTLTKLFGSRDLSTTKPPPKTIWGMVLIRNVQNYREVDPEKKRYDWVPGFMFIEKSLVEIYDTRQDIPLGTPPPLKHEDRYCEDPDCGFHKTIHS
jgi:hypothetical protein